MQNSRQQFAGNLVHVGDHQQQTLGCGIGGCERTSVQGTVHCTGCTSLRLHFLNLDGGPEDVLYTLCRPLVNVVSHGA